MSGEPTARRGWLADVRPLRHADFRRLWIGQGVSFIGLQLTGVALALQVFEVTRSSLWVGLLGLASLVPLLVFGLYGGAVADAVDRRRLLLTGSLVSWGATLGLLLNTVTGLDNPVLMLVLAAVQATGFAFTSPTRGAIIPRLLPVELVPAANTLNFLVSSLGAAVGPLIGGVVLAGAGFEGAYAIDAVLFAVGLYAAVRLPPIPPAEGVGRPGLRSVIEGLRYLGGHPVVLMSFVVDICAMAFALPKALFPEVVAERFGGSPLAYGWLSAAIPIGSVIMGLFSGWIGRVSRQGLALTFVICLWGLVVAWAGAVSQLWLMVLLLAVGGAADLVSSVWRQTILQTHAPDEMRGRMQGVFIVVVAGGPRLGDLRAGAVATAAGVTASWVGGGLLCAAAVLAAGFAVPAFRRYRSEAAHPAR
ncbi:MFS transporter [Bailinhaonella thermotolerans]|uniref:MFS transporter n=1 Tax=Bailinhaonella thermotolerans TaxID=1070861 RepID=A0A3A4B9E4_9ACTN|nr:MFS transporter [Bailinhaonella thermotolerans]RJL30788.1 MFS transporter [Bailinhaonella thermotolerans]